MGKGAEGDYGDYSRTGSAGYGNVPANPGMRSTTGMEGAPPNTMGMGMYGNMGGYGGYGMNGAPAMYQPPAQGSSSPPQGGRSGTDGGYTDAYAAANGGGANGSSGANPSNSNYGGGVSRPQSSSTTQQARVDRSYRPY